MDKSIPDVKKDILFKLAYKPKQRFSDLRDKEVDSKLFTYHLQRLMDDGLVKKENHLYLLTQKGKFYIEHYDWESREYFPNPRVHTLIAAKIKDKFIVLRRKRESYKGFLDFPGGKCGMETDTKKAAENIFFRQTGYRGDLKLSALMQIKNSYKEQIIDNKLFIVYKTNNPKIIKEIHGEKGDIMMMSEEEIRSADRVFPDVIALLDQLKTNKIGYLDFIYYEPFEGKFKLQKIK